MLRIFGVKYTTIGSISFLLKRFTPVQNDEVTLSSVLVHSALMKQMGAKYVS